MGSDGNEDAARCYTCNIVADGHDGGGRVSSAQEGLKKGVAKEKKKVNRPIRQTLLPSLIPEHPELERRVKPNKEGDRGDQVSIWMRLSARILKMPPRRSDRISSARSLA